MVWYSGGKRWVGVCECQTFTELTIAMRCWVQEFLISKLLQQEHKDTSFVANFKLGTHFFPSLMMREPNRGLWT